jgi:hypothetical protein
MWHFADLRFVGPIFCDFRTSAGPQLHTSSPYKYTVAIRYWSNSNLYIIKNRLKRLRLGLFWDRVVQYFVEICEFCALRTGTPKNFADLRYRNEPKNLSICGISLPAHLCEIYTRVLIKLVPQQKRRYLFHNCSSKTSDLNPHNSVHNTQITNKHEVPESEAAKLFISLTAPGF